MIAVLSINTHGNKQGHPVRVKHDAKMHQGLNRGKQKRILGKKRKLNENMVEIYKLYGNRGNL